MPTWHSLYFRMLWAQVYVLLTTLVPLLFSYKPPRTPSYPSPSFSSHSRRPRIPGYNSTLSHDLDLVRLKLHGFVFEVTRYKKEDKSNANAHISRLMKPYQHLMVDLSYTSTIIKSYHPLRIQSEICQLFQKAKREGQSHVATSIFVVNDIGAMVNRPRHDRLLQLFFQITASLGMPTITWLPNRIGEFEVSLIAKNANCVP